MSNSRIDEAIINLNVAISIETRKAVEVGEMHKHDLDIGHAVIDLTEIIATLIVLTGGKSTDLVISKLRAAVMNKQAESDTQFLMERLTKGGRT